MEVPPTAYVWMDGELVAWKDAQLHVTTATLHYGWGVYEGMRAYETSNGPAVFRAEEHLRRMLRSAAIYRMPIPSTVEELTAACLETVRANGLRSCYIRPLAHTTGGDLGINPETSGMRVLVLTWPWENFMGERAREHGVRACVSTWRRIDSGAVPSAGKTCGQYINGMLARGEAARLGFDEAILLNSHDTVADACVENVFVVRDGALVTPPLQDGPLPGVTRASILELARTLGHRTSERSVNRADLYTADELFLTGTAAEVVSVVEVDGRQIGSGRPGPVATGLAQAYQDVVHGRDQRFAHWLTPVAPAVPAGEAAPGRGPLPAAAGSPGRGGVSS